MQEDTCTMHRKYEEEESIFALWPPICCIMQKIKSILKQPMACLLQEDAGGRGT